MELYRKPLSALNVAETVPKSLTKLPEHIHQPHYGEPLLIKQRLTASLSHAGAGHPNKSDVWPEFPQGTHDNGGKLIARRLVGNNTDAHTPS